MALDGPAGGDASPFPTPMCRDASSCAGRRCSKRWTAGRLDPLKGAPAGSATVAFDARRKVILEALKQADFVDPSAPIIDKPDFGRPNLPMLTVTLRLKSDKGL